MTSLRSGSGAGCCRVLFKNYAVCQDYPLDAGRLYCTAGGGKGWTLLGQGLWVYPDPEKLSVCIKGVDRRSIELSEQELDAMDAVQFSAKLHESGYDAPKGSAWYILDYVRSAVDSGAAVTPFGVRNARAWPRSVFGMDASVPWHRTVPERAGYAGMAR